MAETTTSTLSELNQHETHSICKHFEKFMRFMDRYTWIRAMIIFSFYAFYMGNNLNILIWMYLGITFYLLCYSVIRFWVHKVTLYFFEFCYFGLAALLLSICVYPESKLIWYSAYVSNTGLMSFAVIILNNQVAFNNTDLLSSCWLHCMPMIVCWAIRWRNIIYEPAMLSRLTWGFLKVSNENIFSYELILDIIYPIILWFLWGVFYYVMFKILFKNVIDNPKNLTACNDFIKIVHNSQSLQKLFGNPDINGLEKYILAHFIGYVGCIPHALLCYFNFYANTCYMLILMSFLIWNAGTKMQMLEEEKEKLIGELIEKTKSD